MGESRGNTEDRQLWRVSEAATALGVSVQALRRWIRQRRVRVVHLGAAVRIPTSEVVRIASRGL